MGNKFLLFQLSVLLVVALLTPNLPAANPLYAQTDPANLIPDPGFETEVDPWEACGDATQVDIQANGTTADMVHAGRYAVRIHYDTDNLGCGGEAFFDPTAQVGQGFTVPADAQDLTISFWYSRVGDTYFPLQIILGESSDYAEQDVDLAWVEPEELAGWNFYRTELNLQELEAVRGKSINLFFSLFTTTAQGASLANAGPNTSAPGSYYIDDVRVTTAIERTTASPLPADLQSDGTRPLVYLSGEGVARLNTDGSGSQPIDQGFDGDPLNPVWSSAGNKIAVLESSLVPENNTNINVNPAFITILSSMNADGSNVQEIYRTNGLPGHRATPTENEDPALDVEIRSMDWSPDDDALALTICSQNRGINGSTSDAICWVELIDVATGDSLLKIEPAFRPNWSSDNRILFENTDAYRERAFGIWEVDMNQNPPDEALLVPGTGEQLNPSFRTDNWATWSPDNTKFATIRDVAGFHYAADGTRIFHDAIMLFERGNTIGETILLIDHGTSPAGLTWSPDGKYLLYNLFQGNATDIWWLDVTTGQTGKVTNNGASIAPNWRPACIGESCEIPIELETLHLPMIESDEQ